MNSVEFFDHDFLELPIVRTSDDFQEYISNIFDKYIVLIDGLDNSDPLANRIKAQKPKIEGLCNGIKDSISKYYNGLIHSAYDLLKDCIDEYIKEDLLKFKYGLLPEFNTRIYRARLGSLKKYNRKNLFHVPFELRHLIASNRYSIPGLPALYLSGSVWLCWEELGRPEFNSLHVAQYQVADDADVKILDFGIRPKNLSTQITHKGESFFSNSNKMNYVASYAVCWPLIAACSIKALCSKTDNTLVSFVPEYILPQFMLHWVITETQIDGIKYFSSKISDYYPDAGMHMNYVFPARESSPSGFCKELQKKFVLTDPVVCGIALSTSVGGGGGRRPGCQFPVAEGLEVDYTTTDFGRFECILECIGFDTI